MKVSVDPLSSRKDDDIRSTRREDHSKVLVKTTSKKEESVKILSRSSIKKAYKLSVAEQIVYRSKSSTSEDIQEIKKVFPDKFYFKNLRKEKHVKFDKYLMLLEERNDYMTAIEDNSFELTPIPNFIAFLVLAIRDKFEVELQRGTCFLEAKSYPVNEEVASLAEAVYVHSDTYDNVLSTLANHDCLVTFLALLELLQRLEERLIQASPEMMDFVRRSSIFKYLRPHDYVIVDQISEFTTKCFVAPGRSSRPPSKDDPTMNMIDNLMAHYYFDEPKTRLQEIVQRNTFHQLFYRDLRSIKSTSRRYLCRFVLRNCVYLIRRYVAVTSSVLRRRRRESPKENNGTAVPYISGFAIYRMAQFLAASITEIRDTRDDVADRVAFLMNVFSVHMENLWFRQNKMSSVVVSTEQERCHDGCPCDL